MSRTEKRYYNASTLKRSLDSFEEVYDLDSAAFYVAHQADDPTIARIPSRHRHAWASFYREWRSLTGGEFVGMVKRELGLTP